MESFSNYLAKSQSGGKQSNKNKNNNKNKITKKSKIKKKYGGTKRKVDGEENAIRKKHVISLNVPLPYPIANT